MKSLLKSIGNIFPLVILVGCQSSPSPESPAPSDQVRTELSGEISLKADREELAELRKAIPEEKRQANDELAVLLGLLGEVKLRPSEAQERYQRLTLKRREQFRKKVAKLREDFRREESRRKDKFLKAHSSARDEFKKGKPERERTKEFYDEQDRNRRDFFSSEQERRKDFESEIQTQSKDFDSYMREKQKEFSEQMRLYSKRFYEVEREKREGAKRKSGAKEAPANLESPNPPESE